MPAPTNDFEKVTNPLVRAALSAWQGKNLAGWLDSFVAEPTLTDDGAARDFKAFSSQIGNEYFTDIEDVAVDGHTVTGHFHSDTWGDFRTFFHFEPGTGGKFGGLDIGQA